ncbi:MAG TPA: mycofactocin-coupled SDR family oxidoreductase [Acidimicrobiales bacterium]|nr:mycofactocin-coupled SDR family oxidoreductase [Acidimicrobiales bacterium]
MSPVAIVTGAARGIGAATVDALVAEGWHVLAVDRCRDLEGVDYPMATPADLDAVVARHPGRVLGLVGDARSAADMSLAVETAVAQLGGVDAAIAAAGVLAGGAPLWETSDAVYDAVLSVNLDGVRRLFAAAAPVLLEAPAPRRGRLVAVASTAATLGLLHLAAYSASKHAVVGLVRGLAADLASSGVTANAVCPGSTRTAMLEASAMVYGLGSVEEFAVHHPIGRLLEPSEPAALIAWLCSEAASGVTGAAIPVDGGMTSG